MVVVEPRVSDVETIATKNPGIALVSVVGQFPFASGDA